MTITNDPYAAKISKSWTFYNYNARLALNDSLDLYNSHYLNQNGVEKYDSLIIEDSKELGCIKLPMDSLQLN